MSIFVDSKTRLLVQGITGRDGSFHTTEMIRYGTNVVGGVTPGKGGMSFKGPDDGSKKNHPLIVQPSQCMTNSLLSSTRDEFESSVCHRAGGV